MGYIIIWVLSLALVYYFTKLPTKKRIEEIMNLIERMNQRNYAIPMKQDDFSILEDQIYKIFMQLVEEKEKTSIKAQKQIQYLEDIAHQIKTPITNMLFSVEMLEDGKDKNKELILLNKQLQRLNSLADILLKLSSLDAKTDDMKEETIELSEIIDYALDIVEIPKNITLTLEDSIEGKRINGDFYWLSEAVINILKNGIQLPNCSQIKISGDENPLYISLCIQDNGGGIKQSELKKIFKRFYKNPDSQGFGIGLAMAKTIVEKNNGEIEVSNVRDGAEFKIKFYNITQ